MPTPATMSRSRTYPVPVEDAFAGTLAVPLEQMLGRRFGVLPAIVGVEQDGPWGERGQVRTIRTSDGGKGREELTSVDPPRVFTYEVRPQSGPLKPLVERIEGEWRFEPVGTGCRITWSWTVHPTSSATGAGLPVLRRFWLGWARRGLDRLEDLLLAG